jgi:ParB/RepB/Spo0J family partition protein
MAGKRKPKGPAEAKLPKFQRIDMSQIREPDLPARATMRDDKMRELIESMRELGQLDPVIVEEDAGMYEIVAGHRRYLAARELHWRTLNAMVYASGGAPKEAMMLHENLIREELNPAEEALFMAQVREKLGLDEAGLCRVFHRTAEYIGGRFALLRGDPDIFAALQRGELRIGVAHELNRITDEGMRRYYLDLARRSDPSARVVHQWVADWIAQQRPGLPIAPGAELGPGAPAADGASSAPGAPGPDGAAAAAGAPEAPFFGCQLCGGTKDPYNLVTVQMHKWHWADILASVERAAKGES